MEAPDEVVYDQDGLRSIHNHDFMNDPKFIHAYNQASKAESVEKKVHWRMHTLLWTAEYAMNLGEGDFVECGVYKGFFSTGAMDYLNWNSKNKSFYLFDTFKGRDYNQLNEEEKISNPQEQIIQKNLKNLQSIEDVYDIAKRNFLPYKNVHIIKGTIPYSLTQAKIDKVSYLSLDLGCAYPEIEAAKYFWSKMVKGAIAIINSYSYIGYTEQKKVLDKFAKEKGISILSLPTGQGIYIKP